MEPNSPLHKIWKPELYKIQLEAPSPIVIPCRRELQDAPEFYGREYHGVMGHLEVEKLVAGMRDGSFLVRKSPGACDFYTLSLRFNNKTKHFKIYYTSSVGHFLQQNFKCFETIHDLVADGLVNFYMHLHAAPIIKNMILQTSNCYHQSPYMALNRRKLLAISKDIQTSITAESINELVARSISPALETNVLPVVYEKSHTFKIHTFKGLNWCEFCANFLWGFTAQGVKCELCGFTAHYKCSELVPPKCVPDLKRVRGVFGTDLTTVVAAFKCDIPFVVRLCVEEIENRGMLQEGIYRVSGFADEIDALRITLDKEGEKADLSEKTYGNVNVIAGALKLYLRLLPIPLITFQAYPAFMVATRCNNLQEQMRAMRDALKHLPSAHYKSLKYVIEHLYRVASHYDYNKMNEHNLATVFAPTLMPTPKQMTDLSQEIYMLSFLISNSKSLLENEK
uniref:Putative chimerin rho-gtpase-activating protein n=1 Tax=Tabanus bromius TaxID=304241 RepID=A0A0K8TMP0_TABBR